MKIEAKATAGRAAAAPGMRRGAGGDAFQVAPEAAARPATAAATMRAVGGIDALLVLQAFDDPAERRRRAVRSGRVTLDTLDEIKVALLSGTLTPATLRRLKAAAAGLAEASGDGGLDAVLAAIALRAEVELAKLAPTGTPPKPSKRLLSRGDSPSARA